MPPAGWGPCPLHPEKVLYKQLTKNYHEISQLQYSGSAGGRIACESHDSSPAFAFLRINHTPFSSCNFTATGETADDVTNKMFADAQEAHADVLASMSEQDMKDVQGKMDSLLV